MFVGQRSQTQGPGLYMLPAGITVDEDGRVYVVDQFFRKVDIYRPANVAKNGGYLGENTCQKQKTESNSLPDIVCL